MSSPPVLIDSHVHVVAEDQERYPLDPAGLPGAWYREAPHDAEQFLACMQEAGVAGAVLVQPVGAYSYDNRYAADSAERHPGKFVSACCIDPDHADPVRELRSWIEGRGMQGVRFFDLDPKGPGRINQPSHRALWECADDLGAHVIVTIFAHQLTELEAVLRRYPQIRISLDHCGFPPVEGPPWRDSRSLSELARYRNLYLKITSHLLHTVEAKGHSPTAWVEHLVSRFGAEQLMWGSDFSQTHRGGYVGLVEFARHAFGSLPVEEQALCLGGTATRLWPGLAPKTGARG